MTIKNKILAAFVLLLSLSPVSFARDQWSVKRAQKWEKEVGVLKGANGYYMVNPAQSDREVFAKMKELGFNSVRAWISGATAEEQIAKLSKLLDDAGTYGITVSPVVVVNGMFEDPAMDEQTYPEAEKFLKTLMGHFRKDKRIVYWDMWNEPPYNPSRNDVMRVMDILSRMVVWAREANVRQPITSSIFWDSGNELSDDAPTLRRRLEVEGMMDIHNFHDYTSGMADGAYLKKVIARMKAMDDRPIVCSECLNRQNGSGIERTLSILAQEHVHFYVWGVYSNDRNWNTRWSRSEFDPYARMFHNVLYADGDPYSEQEIQWIKDYHFCEEGEVLDPGLEYTERWRHDRIWRRMVTGPVKGFVTEDIGSVPEGYNNALISISHDSWLKDSDAAFAKFDEVLSAAEAKGIQVIPTLLKPGEVSKDKAVEFVRDVVKHYAHHNAIYAWNLCDAPSDIETVTAIFKAARSCQASQPMFMTPSFSLKEFPADFNYAAAMVHGRTGGWEHFDFASPEMEQICAKVWSLSDVIAYHSDTDSNHIGWTGAVARRYGRPVFVFVDGNIKDESVKGCLDLFANTQLYWWTSSTICKETLDSFGFNTVNYR